MHQTTIHQTLRAVTIWLHEDDHFDYAYEQYMPPRTFRVVTLEVYPHSDDVGLGDPNDLSLRVSSAKFANQAPTSVVDLVSRVWAVIKEPVRNLNDDEIALATISRNHDRKLNPPSLLQSLWNRFTGGSD